MKNTTYDTGNSTMSRSGATFSLNPTTNVVLDVNCPTRPTSFVKGGFTLAEVLITLGVIGVVAAITLPTLIQNYQKKQTVTQLKKAYSELSQAISTAQKDFGTFEDWDFADFPTDADRAQYFYENFLKPNLKISKYCAPSSNECWADDSFTLTGNKYTPLNSGVPGRCSFVTASGYSVFYWLHGSGTGGWFFVDLNGKKKPNILGKDIFVYILGNGNISETYKDRMGLNPHGMHKKAVLTREDIISGNYPYNVNYDAGGCSTSSTRSPGVSCAALIMLDGWEIKDDYPW